MSFAMAYDEDRPIEQGKRAMFGLCCKLCVSLMPAHELAVFLLYARWLWNALSVV